MKRIGTIGNPMLTAALMAYAMSGKSEAVDDTIFNYHTGWRNSPEPAIGSQGNKYQPNECSNSRAKARRLKQMNRALKISADEPTKKENR